MTTPPLESWEKEKIKDATLEASPIAVFGIP